MTKDIGLLLYPEFQAAASYGLTDLFRVANSIARRYAPESRTELRVSHWQKTSNSSRIERVFDTHPDQKNNGLVFLIVPPSLGDPITSETAAPFARWLIDLHAAGTSLCSICAGAFVLAETGLLAGRSSTTHWIYAQELARRYPDIHVNVNKLVIEDGDIITAGGLMAWTDLGLKLVDRLLGSTVMLETARYMLVDPPGREQRYYSNFSPMLQHGDAAILKVQHWLQSNGAVNVTLPAMANQAGLEERTFLRRFRKATGLKPTEYCQNLRIGKARELLEFTNENIEQVSWAIGYEDPGAFRKVFFKIMGLSPGDYRNRFSLVKGGLDELPE